MNKFFLRKLLIFNIVLLVGGIFNVTGTSSEWSETRILGIKLPTDVSMMIKRFGEPNKVEVPEGAELEGSPMGQWFRWAVDGGAGIFSVLGDEYTGTPNDHAEVRFIQYMATDKKGEKTVYGFLFNTTMRSEVEKKFKGRIEACRGNYLAWHQDVLKLIENDQFVYFFFSSKHLIGVAQSTFDMDMAG